MSHSQLEGSSLVHKKSPSSSLYTMLAAALPDPHLGLYGWDISKPRDPSAGELDLEGDRERFYLHAQQQSFCGSTPAGHLVKLHTVAP